MSCQNEKAHVGSLGQCSESLSGKQVMVLSFKAKQTGFASWLPYIVAERH